MLGTRSGGGGDYGGGDAGGGDMGGGGGSRYNRDRAPAGGARSGSGGPSWDAPKGGDLDDEIPF